MKKFNINSSIVCAALFIVTIFIFGVATMITRAKPLVKSILTPLKYPNGIVQTYKDLHESFTKEADKSSFTDNLWNRLAFIDVYSISQYIFMSHVNEDVSETIVKDNHGNLHFMEPRVTNAAKYAEKTINLQASVNAPILYVQAPNKKLKGYTVMPRNFDNYSNDNADDFLSAIDGKVDYMDLRVKLEEEKLDKSKLFYVTDHHWTTEAAFWGFQKTIEKLNTEYNFDLDPENFYTDIDNYSKTLYEKSFLGSQGRRVGRFYAGVDDYTLLLPKFETSFITNDTVNSPDKPVSEGDFEKAFINKDLLDSWDVSANKHASYLSLDRGEFIIHNNLIENGKRIIMIKDSFALPYACFMAPCFEEIVMLDMRYFSTKQNLVEYINNYDPDAVLFLYNTEIYIDSMFPF